VAPGEIFRNLTFKDCFVIQKRVSSAPATLCGFCNSPLDRAAQEFAEGNAGGSRLLQRGLLQARR